MQVLSRMNGLQYFENLNWVYSSNISVGSSCQHASRACHLDNKCIYLSADHDVTALTAICLSHLLQSPIGYKRNCIMIAMQLHMYRGPYILLETQPPLDNFFLLLEQHTCRMTTADHDNSAHQRKPLLKGCSHIYLFPHAPADMPVVCQASMASPSANTEMNSDLMASTYIILPVS